MIHRRAAGGFTLFELVVATIIVVLLTFLLLNRLQTYQREAERVAVERFVGTLRTALRINITQHLVAKREQGLRSIIDENPMRWLVQPPTNYLGEFYAPEGNSLPEGIWYFDKTEKELVYTLTETKTFRPRKQMLLKFKVKFLDLPLQQGKGLGQPSTQKTAVLDQVSEKTVVNN